MAPVLLNPSRFGGGGGGGGGFSGEVLADSPLAYWKLDETSGTTAADSSGNSRTATYSFVTPGSASLLTDGSGHSATLIQDTGGGVNIASAAWMNVSALSVEALIKFSSAVDASNGDAIVSRYGAGGAQWLLWRNTAGKLAFQLQISGTGFINCTGTTTATLGTRYDVGATWDGSTAKLFVGGTQEASIAAAGSLVASTEALRIGCYSNSAGTVPGALVDEVSFYGTALSGARMTAHAAAA